VLGRVFWGGAVVALGAAVAAIIEGLRAAGLVFARERSSFAGQQEFIFKHPRFVHVLLGGLVHLEHVCHLLLACGMYRGGHARLQRRSQMHMGLQWRGHVAARLKSAA
jgi:hypothetical protein